MAQKLLSGLYLFGLDASVPKVAGEGLSMGWSSRLPSVASALVVGILGTGTAFAQIPDEPPIRGKVLQLGAPGFLDWKVAERVERRLRARGVLGRAGKVPVAMHAPMPVPAMPLPAGFTPPAGYVAMDAAPAASFSFDEPMAPATSAGFRALGDNNGAIPPDTHGAVGPTELMTTLNTQVRRQDRSGNPVGSLLSLYGFWVSAGVSPSAPPNGPFDPRVHFDPEAGRWITVACQAAANQSSALLVAVSTSSTPGAWHAWKIPADPGNLPASGVWFDYPNVGFNKKWIVVQVNVFTYTVPATTNDFVESRIYVFDKSLLYQGLPNTPTVITPAPLTYGATQVPAQTYDFLADDLYLMQRWNPDVSGTGYLRVYQLSGDVGSETLTPLGLPSAPAWSESAAGMADFAPQGPSCGANKIQTNDSRIQNVVQRNGRLWATHTVFYPAGGTPTRASVQWWEVATDATVLQTGLVDDPGNARFYAFPSIAVNKDEDALLGFSSFSASQTASAGYTFRLAGDPPGTMQVPRVLKAGEACYYKAPTGRNRWGDFSATQVDPLDDTNLWTIQEYAAATDVNNAPATNVWSTWWGMVAPPAISIADASVTEGNAGTTLLTFNLGLSVQTSETVTVQWATANDTATDVDDDYVAATGTVTFAPNSTTATLQVTVKGDVKNEANETFFVNLSSPLYATLPDAQAVGTVLNDDVPQISIGDVQVVEGSAGNTSAVFTVSLSYPSAAPVSATWTTTPDSATAGADYVVGGGTVGFPIGVATQTVTVQVVGDTTPESTERFFVDLSAPVGGTLLKSRGNGVILDDDSTTTPPVTDLVVVSDGGGSPGRNRLQWLNPTGGAPTGIRIKWNQAASCAPPDPTQPNGASDGTVSPDEPFSGAGTIQGYEHNGRPLDQEHCYTVWVQYGAAWSIPGATGRGRPFDSSGKVKWKYFAGTGATTVAPPTVGTDGVLVPSNDGFVHAMVRGSSGGPWPAPSWKPVNLGSPAQVRSPIVPLAVGSRAFYTTQDGWVHAVDATTGAIVWETQIGIAAQAAPAGIFVAFGGAWDYLLVGTRQTNVNKFYALDPLTGGVIDVFPQGAEGGVSGMGQISGMAAVDYAGSRVYFGSRRGTLTDATETLWCLKLGPPVDALSLEWKSGVPGEIDGSPVLRGTRVYVGDVDGKVWSLPMDGTSGYSLDLGDGAVKGFPFPDRRNNDLFVATSTKVWGLTDSVGTSLGYKWTNPVQGLDSPSVVLLKPGTNELYVGVRDIVPAGLPDSAGLLRIDVSLADPGLSAASLALEGFAAVVGAPSLDVGFTPNLLHVGSEGGVLYAVEVPF
jgi:hypothetical protein